jgi:hypothetical protein
MNSIARETYECEHQTEHCKPFAPPQFLEACIEDDKISAIEIFNTAHKVNASRILPSGFHFKGLWSDAIVGARLLFARIKTPSRSCSVSTLAAATLREADCRFGGQVCSSECRKFAISCRRPVFIALEHVRRLSGARYRNLKGLLETSFLIVTQ